MKKYTSEEIKNRLSNIGEAIGEISLKYIVSLEQENEQLKQLVLHLEDNLRVARKDREDLKDCVANGLEEFIKEKPHTSLSLLANKKSKEENEQLKAQIETMRQDVNDMKYFTSFGMVSKACAELLRKWELEQ